MGTRNSLFMPAALTIAGSDSGGNAGIQADLRAFHAFGVHGCTAICALTAQNPKGVFDVLTVDPRFLTSQLEAVFSCYSLGALKTGMLSSSALIDVVAHFISFHPDVPAVVDPVMVATSGARLLEDSAVDALKTRLAPLATLLTPNLPEGSVLLGSEIRNREEAVRAVARLSDMFGCAVLLKGGHAKGRQGEDLFCSGGKIMSFATPAVENPISTHGTGCSLSAAIAASLAAGRRLEDAIAEGKAYVYEAIRNGKRVGDDAAVMGMPEKIPVDVVRRKAL